MSDQACPIRLIICVDGALRAEDQATSIHRIYSGAKSGKCVDITGELWDQRPVYVPAVGSGDDVFLKDRLQASVLGQGYVKQIRHVYESCCRLRDSRDEVWLFGFGRGGFVARAVAGLLHHYGALASAGQLDFSKDFKKLLKTIESRTGSGSSLLTPVNFNLSSV